LYTLYTKSYHPKPVHPLPVPDRPMINYATIIQKKFKSFIYPFINRVSANIYDRELYYIKLLKKLNIDITSKNNCLRLYKITNGNPEFTIGDSNIHLKNQIGTKSKMGLIYLGGFKDDTGKLFKYAIKIGLLKDSEKEIEILEKLRKDLLDHKTPHFPLLYSTLYCDDLRNEIKKVDPKDLTMFPKLLANAGKKKTPLVILLNELANGDLKTFIHENLNNTELLKNSYIQVQLALFSFYMTSGALHMDSHWGNFLYHKIKPGGYFHYNICDKDYYLKNIGYLWVIWDFGLSKYLSSNPASMNYDTSRIMKSFYHKNNNGLLDNKLKFDKEISSFALQIYNKYFIENKKASYNGFFTPKAMNLYISSLMEDLLKNNWITIITPPKKEIINDKPYKIKF